MTGWFAPEDVYRAVPARPGGTGVLVLAGSSGRIDRQRADLVARHGAQAVSVRWFGGTGQRPFPQEVPLESFSAALDLLAVDCDRLAVVGTSFGAEAALLTAAADPRVAAVVGFAPSAVVWGWHAEGRWSSHWTARGRPLPYVPFVEDWQPDREPPAFAGLYEQSLAAAPAAVAAASIPVERIPGDVVLVAGGDDQVWPSARFAEMIAATRDRAGLATTLVAHPDAGHRTILPGESPATGGMTMARGGTPAADAALGRQAWPHLTRVLQLHADAAAPSG